MPWKKLHSINLNFNILICLSTMLKENSSLYLLIHTMTITEYDYVLQAQYFHTFSDSIEHIENATFIGRRLSYRLHPGSRVSRSKINLQRLNAPSLRTMMKRNSNRIKHHLRAINIGSQSRVNLLRNQLLVKPNDERSVPEDILSSDSASLEATENKAVSETASHNDQLSTDATPQQTNNWLTANRFGKYLQTFASFSGADLLRMSRDDLIQICGQADGIRLYNALNSKAITPRLTIYVCQDKTKVYHAIFLNSYNNMELLQKLSTLHGVPQNQVKDIYMQGPQSIHIHLNNDVLRHIKEETMFTFELLQENDGYIFLLKPILK